MRHFSIKYLSSDNMLHLTVIVAHLQLLLLLLLALLLAVLLDEVEAAPVGPFPLAAAWLELIRNARICRFVFLAARDVGDKSRLSFF